MHVAQKPEGLRMSLLRYAALGALFWATSWLLWHPTIALWLLITSALCALLIDLTVVTFAWKEGSSKLKTCFIGCTCLVSYLAVAVATYFLICERHLIEYWGFIDPSSEVAEYARHHDPQIIIKVFLAPWILLVISLLPLAAIAFIVGILLGGMIQSLLLALLPNEWVAALRKMRDRASMLCQRLPGYGRQHRAPFVGAPAVVRETWFCLLSRRALLCPDCERSQAISEAAKAEERIVAR